MGFLIIYLRVLALTHLYMYIMGFFKSLSTKGFDQFLDEIENTLERFHALGPMPEPCS